MVIHLHPLLYETTDGEREERRGVVRERGIKAKSSYEMLRRKKARLEAAY